MTQAIQLHIDDKSLMRGFMDFKNMNPIAVRNTLNTAAAISRRNAIKEVKDDFILRNTWTTKNIQFDQATGRNINKMKSKVGATQAADYMEVQEFGGRRRSKGKNTAIAMSAARLGASKKKPVSKSMYISKISARMVTGPHKKRYSSRRAKRVAEMYIGYKKKKFVRRGDDIFKVVTFDNMPRVKITLKHLYTIEEKPIRIPKTAWLGPAIKRPSRDLDNIYRSQLRKLWKSAPESL